MAYRPRVPGVPSRRAVVVRMTDDEVRAVRRLARREGLTVADLLRIAVLGYAADGGDPLPGITLFSARAGQAYSDTSMDPANCGDDGEDDRDGTTELQRTRERQGDRRRQA